MSNKTIKEIEEVIKDIQKLKKEVKNLKTKNNDLKIRIASLESSLNISNMFALFTKEITKKYSLENEPRIHESIKDLQNNIKQIKKDIFYLESLLELEKDSTKVH